MPEAMQGNPWQSIFSHHHEQILRQLIRFRWCPIRPQNNPLFRVIAPPSLPCTLQDSF